VVVSVSRDATQAATTYWAPWCNGVDAGKVWENTRLSVGQTKVKSIGWTALSTFFLFCRKVLFGLAWNDDVIPFSSEHSGSEGIDTRLSIFLLRLCMYTGTGGTIWLIRAL